MNILLEADKLIHGERVKLYGKPTESFQRIAEIASITCGKSITPSDVCKVLVAQKLVRDCTSPENIDHITDICGYLGILADLREDMLSLNHLRRTREYPNELNFQTKDAKKMITIPCNKCKLHLHRKNVVQGYGNAHPRIMFIGNAPGTDDDVKGKPFSGGAGRILYSLISEARIMCSDCYFTNMVCCKPLHNREPNQEELFSCQERLRKEILSTKPDVIVTLGDLACKQLTGQALSTHRGAVMPGIGPATGFTVVPTFDPLFTMRMRAMYPVTAWDIRKAVTTWPEVPIEYLINPDDSTVHQWLASYMGLETAVDIETMSDPDEGGDADALNPWRGEIIGISFCSEPGKALALSQQSMLRNHDIIKHFLQSTPCGWANTNFDRAYLSVKYGYIADNSWDVQDAIHLIHSGLPKKLDFLRSIYTNMPPYKLQYRNTKGKYRPGDLPEYSAAELACKDTDCTRRVWLAQKAFVSQSCMNDFCEEDDMALEMKLKGCFIDQHAVAKHFIAINPEIQQLEDKYFDKYDCNIASPKQLAKLLFETLKLPAAAKHKTATGIDSTNEKAIQDLGSRLGLVYINDDEGERFEGEHEHAGILADILRYRGLAKLSSTYCEGIIQAIEHDNRVHPQWSPNGTDTGRWSCRGVPLQGVPKSMRDIVTAAPGNILFGADFKGAQIVGAAILAQDWELVENMLKPRYSIHFDVMNAIKPHYPNITKTQAKAVVFGTFFGSTPQTIAANFHVSVETVKLWQGIFYSQRPKLKEYFEEFLPNEWKTKGYIKTIDGRKKYCQAVTEAKNTPVQNFEAVVVKKAMKELRKAGFTIIMLGHDQVVCEEPLNNDTNKRFKQFINILESSSPELYRFFPVSGGMGNRWCDLDTRCPKCQEEMIHCEDDTWGCSKCETTIPNSEVYPL